MYEDCQLEVSSREAAGLGARVHRPNGHVLCDDEVWGRIARIVASRPKTLQAQSYIYICNVSVSSRSVSGQNAVPGIGSDSGKHERECEIRWRRPDPTSSRRCVRDYRSSLIHS